MAEPFIGEIKMFAGTFAPRNWAFCDGQLLSVSGSAALYFRGRLPLHMGTGAGLTPRPIGQRAGFERVTLTGNQLPSHGHTLNATNETADSQAAAGLLRGQTTDDTYSTIDSTLTMPASSTTAAGGSQSHDNVQPFLCINFIIALVGIYPSRS
jgi:microcystin-dependent protein